MAAPQASGGAEDNNNGSLPGRGPNAYYNHNAAAPERNCPDWLPPLPRNGGGLALRAVFSSILQKGQLPQGPLALSFMEVSSHDVDGCQNTQRWSHKA